MALFVIDDWRHRKMIDKLLAGTVDLYESVRDKASYHEPPSAWCDTRSHDGYISAVIILLKELVLGPKASAGLEPISKMPGTGNI